LWVGNFLNPSEPNSLINAITVLCETPSIGLFVLHFTPMIPTETDKQK